MKHVPNPKASPVVHSFICSLADDLDQVVKLELDGHARRDPKFQPCVPMPLLYPPTMPSSITQRVGGEILGGQSQAEKSKTIMEKRQKTVKKQLQTIRKKNFALDKSGADDALRFLGIEEKT